MRNAMNRNVPWSILNVSKLVFTAALIILTAVDLVMAINSRLEAHIYPVDFYTPIIKIATFVSTILFCVPPIDKVLNGTLIR